MRWRTGRKVLRTVYEQRGPEPSDDDTLIGMLDHPAQAALAVRCVNATITGEELRPAMVSMPLTVACPLDDCEYTGMGGGPLVNHWVTTHGDMTLEKDTEELRASRNYYRKALCDLGPWLADLLRKGWTVDETVSFMHAHMTMILQRAPERR